MITEKDLKLKYPEARFYSVTLEEFNALSSTYKHDGMFIAMADTKPDARMHESLLPKHEILTPALLKTKYPDADFGVTTLNNIEIDTVLRSNKQIIIACNSTIPPKNGNREQTFETILEHYPDETFTVFYPESTEAFNALKNGLEGVGGIIVTTTVETKETAKADESTPSKTRRHHSGRPDFDISGSCLTDLPDLGDDGAVVLFVVIGVFVVAALVIYGGKFIYDAVTDKAEHSYSFELSQTFTLFGRERNNGVSEKGAMVGVKCVANIEDDDFQVGLAFEAGNMDIEIYNDDSDNICTIDGFYWMTGPHLGFPFNATSADDNPSCIMIEVLAGKTEHENAGFISAARAGVTFGIKEHVRFGVHIGSFYFDLDETEGILDLDKTDGISTEEDRFRFTAGFEVGYRF